MREDYLALIKAWLTGRLKFVDETGVNLALTRAYGRAQRGERICEGVPHRHVDNVTVVAAMGLGGLSAPWQLPGSMDTEAFEVWVGEVLGPTLEEGDIVVMDNLRVHKAASIERLIQARGARLEFLPPYSPD
jgi:hypothetical protein